MSFKLEYFRLTLSTTMAGIWYRHFGGTCPTCGLMNDWHLAHDIAKSLNPSIATDPLNVLWLCRSCNSEQGTKSFAKFVQQRAATRELPGAKDHKSQLLMAMTIAALAKAYRIDVINDKEEVRKKTRQILIARGWDMVGEMSDKQAGEKFADFIQYLDGGGRV